MLALVVLRLIKNEFRVCLKLAGLLRLVSKFDGSGVCLWWLQSLVEAALGWV